MKSSAFPREPSTDEVDARSFSAISASIENSITSSIPFLTTEAVHDISLTEPWITWGIVRAIRLLATSSSVDEIAVDMPIRFETEATPSAERNPSIADLEELALRIAMRELEERFG